MVGLIQSLDFESDRIQTKNFLELDFESMAIRFGSPHCLSLKINKFYTKKIKKIILLRKKKKTAYLVFEKWITITFYCLPISLFCLFSFSFLFDCCKPSLKQL